MSESRDAEISAAIDDLVTGEMSREDFVRRATVLGLSMTAIGGMIAAAGGWVGAAQARPFGGQTVCILIAAEGDEKGVKD